jgi:peptide/nickel transport system permease protein
MQSLLLAVIRGLLTAWLTGLIAFALLKHVMPPPSTTLLSRHASVEQQDAYLKAIGFQRPTLLAYNELLASYLQGDLGQSWVNQQSVGPSVRQRLWVSCLLLLPGSIMAHLFAFFAAKTSRRGIAASVAQMSTAAGVLLCTVLVQWLLCAPDMLGWFPVFGIDTRTLSTYLISIAAPSSALALAIYGTLFPFYRNLLEHPQRARAWLCGKALGLSGWRLQAYCDRPLLGLILARICSELPLLLMGGSLVVEMVFVVPGLARLGFDAALNNDMPVLVAISVLAALGISVGVTLGDLALRLLDPRLRADAKVLS